MDKQLAIRQSPMFNSVFIFLQTSISILPGLLQLKSEHIKRFPVFFAGLIIYLLLSQWYQLLIHNYYLRGQRVPRSVTRLKLFIAALLIAYITLQTTLIHGVILFMYEFFQYLQNSWRYRYIETFSYNLTAAFFSGIAFNLIIVLDTPFQFTIYNLHPFLFSFILVLLLQILLQTDNVGLRKRKFLLLSFILLFFSLNAYIVYQFLYQQIDLLQLVLLCVTSSISALCLFSTIKFKNPVVITSIMLILDMFIYYL